MVLQFLLSLSILIVTHEGGHFFFAKLFHIRVEKFYLFFDPWFSLFKVQRGETEYGIGWLPLGGYVKIAGMIDESMDTEQMKQPVQEWEFRAKPAWQRLLVMLGGVLVNFIEAPLIFWLILYTWGESYIPMSQAPNGYEYSEVMHKVGFVDGDIPLSVNGTPIDKQKDFINAILYDDPCTIAVRRNGDTAQVEIPHEFFRQILKDSKQPLMTFSMPAVVDSVIGGSAAELAGMAHGDTIVAINGTQIQTFRQFTTLLTDNAGKDLQMAVVRANGSRDTLNAKVGDDGKLGFFGQNITSFVNPQIHEYSFFEALPAGISKGWEILSSYVRQFRMVFTKEGATQIGGFGTIANMFPKTWDWQSFWFNTAFLAIILAFMNILPIPALDGGHVLFLLIEVITGKKVSDKTLETAQTIGMLLLFALLIYANGADIFRAFFK